MSAELRDQIARYIDGRASSRERAALERAMVDHDVARLFAEELLLRDLLRHAPPEVPPEQVVARWEAAVLGELDLASEDTPGWFSQALEGLGWTVRGPAMSLAASGATARLAMSTLRSGLPSRGDTLATAPKAKKAWWRRALSWRSR